MAKFDAVFKPRFLHDQEYWIKTNPKTAAKVRTLVSAILEDPFGGIGKPEPLRSLALQDCWSRRITKEHRLVYQVDKGTVSFLQCRHHY